MESLTLRNICDILNPIPRLPKFDGQNFLNSSPEYPQIFVSPTVFILDRDNPYKFQNDDIKIEVKIDCDQLLVNNKQIYDLGNFSKSKLIVILCYKDNAKIITDDQFISIDCYSKKIILNTKYKNFRLYSNGEIIADNKIYCCNPYNGDIVYESKDLMIIKNKADSVSFYYKQGDGYLNQIYIVAIRGWTISSRKAKKIEYAEEILDKVGFIILRSNKTSYTEADFPELDPEDINVLYENDLQIKPLN